MLQIIVPLVAALGVILVQVLALYLSYRRSLITRNDIGEVKHLVNSHTEKLEARIQQLEHHIWAAGGPVPHQPSPQEKGGAK